MCFLAKFESTPLHQPLFHLLLKLRTLAFLLGNLVSLYLEEKICWLVCFLAQNDDNVRFIMPWIHCLFELISFRYAVKKINGVCKLISREFSLKIEGLNRKVKTPCQLFCLSFLVQCIRSFLCRFYHSGRKSFKVKRKH